MNSQWDYSRCVKLIKPVNLCRIKAIDDKIFRAGIVSLLYVCTVPSTKGPWPLGACAIQFFNVNINNNIKKGVSHLFITLNEGTWLAKLKIVS